MFASNIEGTFTVNCTSAAWHMHLRTTARLCLTVCDCSHIAGGFSADLCVFAGLRLAVAQKPSR